jgi:hypothetical protein
MTWVAESKALLTAWNDARIYIESVELIEIPQSQWGILHLYFGNWLNVTPFKILGGWFYAMARCLQGPARVALRRSNLCVVEKSTLSAV